MKSEFVCLVDPFNVDTRYWLIYTDEVMDMLSQTYVMSKRTGIFSILDYKLGVL